MQDATYIILAGGNGERMNSSFPVAMQKVSGKFILDRMISEIKKGSAALPFVVVKETHAFAALKNEASFVLQPEPIGEVNALKCALNQINTYGLAVVLYGNMPTLESDYISALVKAAEKYGAANLVYSDGESEDLIKSGAYCFSSNVLADAIHAIPDSASMTDLSDHISAMGFDVHELMVDIQAVFSVVDRAALCYAEKCVQSNTTNKLMQAGVTIYDPSSIIIEEGVSIGKDTVIWPNVTITGNTTIGARCVIKGGCQIHNSSFGDDCVLQYVVSNDAKVGNGVTMGPFVNLRPDTNIADDCKVGDFIEVKNANIGKGSKLPHLSYVGDADVGERVNLGCGSVFVNYDGFAKHRTIVGDDVFIGCQTNLIAPIKVGSGAYTAAGSTLNKDVPEGAMAFGRARQENKEGYVDFFRKLKKKN